MASAEYSGITRADMEHEGHGVGPESETPVDDSTPIESLKVLTLATLWACGSVTCSVTGEPDPFTTMS